MASLAVELGSGSASEVELAQTQSSAAEEGTQGGPDVPGSAHSIRQSKLPLSYGGSIGAAASGGGQRQQAEQQQQQQQQQEEQAAQQQDQAVQHAAGSTGDGPHNRKLLSVRGCCRAVQGFWADLQVCEPPTVP
jgi:hypothetical protein